jgi:hypothetical protein
VWCGVVWCGVVWCGVVWCGVVWCGSSSDEHINTHSLACMRPQCSMQDSWISGPAEVQEQSSTRTNVYTSHDKRVRAHTFTIHT